MGNILVRVYCYKGLVLGLGGRNLSTDIKTAGCATSIKMDL